MSLPESPVARLAIAHRPNSQPGTDRIASQAHRELRGRELEVGDVAALNGQHDLAHRLEPGHQPS